MTLSNEQIEKRIVWLENQLKKKPIYSTQDPKLNKREDKRFSLRQDVWEEELAVYQQAKRANELEESFKKIADWLKREEMWDEAWDSDLDEKYLHKFLSVSRGITKQALKKESK